MKKPSLIQPIRFYDVTESVDKFSYYEKIGSIAGTLVNVPTDKLMHFQIELPSDYFTITAFKVYCPNGSTVLRDCLAALKTATDLKITRYTDIDNNEVNILQYNNSDGFESLGVPVNCGLGTAKIYLKVTNTGGDNKEFWSDLITLFDPATAYIPDSITDLIDIDITA